MAKGTVVYVDGGKIGLNTDGKKDKDGKWVADTVVKDCKGCPCTVDGVDNKRVADIKPGMSVRITETGGKPTNIVAAGGK